MKKWLIICAAAIQVLTIGYTAAEREFIVLNGRTVFLRTAPVDPRDVFRGDYVRLDYEVSHIPDALMTDSLRNRKKEISAYPERAINVFAVLKVEGGLGEVDSLTDVMPGNGLFIKGRIENNRWGGDANLAKYGIEAFFVQQKKGLDIERGRNDESIQVPLEMEVAVGRSGTAVLKGYRWSSIGIGMTRDTGTNRLIRSATITLKNMSSNDIAVVDLPGGASLSLEKDFTRGSSAQEWKWVDAGKQTPAVTEEHVIVLKPDQAHAIQLDLTDPAWFVRKGSDKPVPVSEMEWGPWFRLVYRPPSVADCAHLRNAGIIWHGHLISSSFNGGSVD